jgi:hypothetical protein
MQWRRFFFFLELLSVRTRCRASIIIQKASTRVRNGSYQHRRSYRSSLRNLWRGNWRRHSSGMHIDFGTLSRERHKSKRCPLYWKSSGPIQTNYSQPNAKDWCRKASQCRTITPVPTLEPKPLTASTNWNWGVESSSCHMLQFCLRPPISCLVHQQISCGITIWKMIKKWKPRYLCGLPFEDSRFLEGIQKLLDLWTKYINRVCTTNTNAVKD